MDDLVPGDVVKLAGRPKGQLWIYTRSDDLPGGPFGIFKHVPGDGQEDRGEADFRSASFAGRFELGMPVRHQDRDVTISAMKNDFAYVRFNDCEVHAPVPITELVQENFGLFIQSKERNNGQEAQAQS
jgi:hypothetical protein